VSWGFSWMTHAVIWRVFRQFFNCRISQFNHFIHDTYICCVIAQ
jgi:hypothetical protein